jgi:Fe-S-cluster containining protein
MGDVIGIQEEIACLRFRVWYKITGETREVAIDPDKRDLFLRQDLRLRRPPACPFLRESSGRYICTVHSSRPDLCRQYTCFCILVLNEAGDRLGRVIADSRYFTTMDPALKELWDREIRNRPIPDEQLFEDYVEQVLTRERYRVLR